MSYKILKEIIIIFNKLCNINIIFFLIKVLVIIEMLLDNKTTINEFNYKIKRRLWTNTTMCLKLEILKSFYFLLQKPTK